MDSPSFSRPGRACALTLLLLLGAAGALSLALRPPRATADTHRNPHGVRDWLHYVQATAPRRPSEILVVLISNSQGYGFGENERDTYATLLESELARRWRRPVRVANWSIPGGGGPEFVLMAAAARRLRPDWIVTVLGANNLTESSVTRRGQPVPLTYFASDARHLIALRGVARRLPPDFARHYLTAPAQADAWLARLWRPWVYRDAPLCRLSACPALAPFLPANLRRSWEDVPLDLLGAGLWREVSESPVSEFLLRAYGEALLGAAPHQLFLQMPAAADLPLRHKEMPLAALAPWLAAGGVFEDWTRKIPDRGFREAAHFNPKGHRAMAQALAERMAP